MTVSDSEAGIENTGSHMDGPVYCVLAYFDALSLAPVT